MKQILAVVLSMFLCVQPVFAMPAREKIMYTETKEQSEEKTEEGNVNLELSAPSAVLMEASTGQIIYEKSPHEQMPPASVTKVMTMLLIFDALEKGKINLNDMVTVSEYAASMGGSQVFLEPGETQTVDTLIKCIAVASANDACVAMAEYIAGSEEEFVSQMNARAKGLGMKDTRFLNCNGLDKEGHLTTAYDIALMSRELITKHPEVHDYTMIWMENIVHKTKKGESEFGLSNTNKFIKQYTYATGLKTGSTSKAKFCLSATAKKDDLDLIAVVMAAPDSKQRVKDATALMNYGFGKCQKYTAPEEHLKAMPVERGMQEMVPLQVEERVRYIDITGADLSEVNRKIRLPKSVKAPIKKGDKIGEIKYYLKGTEIGSTEIKASESVHEIDYKASLVNVLEAFAL